MEYYSSLAKALKSFTGARSPKNIKLYQNQHSKQKHKIKQMYVQDLFTAYFFNMFPTKIFSYTQQHTKVTCKMLTNDYRYSEV